MKRWRQNLNENGAGGNQQWNKSVGISSGLRSANTGGGHTPRLHYL